VRNQCLKCLRPSLKWRSLESVRKNMKCGVLPDADNGMKSFSGWLQDVVKGFTVMISVMCWPDKPLGHLWTFIFSVCILVNTSCLSQSVLFRVLHPSFLHSFINIACIEWVDTGKGPIIHYNTIFVYRRLDRTPAPQSVVNRLGLKLIDLSIWHACNECAVSSISSECNWFKCLMLS